MLSARDERPERSCDSTTRPQRAPVAGAYAPAAAQSTLSQAAQAVLPLTSRAALGRPCSRIQPGSSSLCAARRRGEAVWLSQPYIFSVVIECKFHMKMGVSRSPARGRARTTTGAAMMRRLRVLVVCLSLVAIALPPPSWRHRRWRARLGHHWGASLRPIQAGQRLHQPGHRDRRVSPASIYWPAYRTIGKAAVGLRAPDRPI